MGGVNLNLEALDKVTWPAACPACGHQTNETDGGLTDVKVKKGIKTSFASGTPKKVSVRLCARCISRVSRAEKMGKFGWGLAGITFLLGVLHAPANQLQWSGVGFGFWLGAILGWIGERRKKSLVGLQPTRVSKDTWHFRFKNQSFADSFLTANKQFVKNE